MQWWVSNCRGWWKERFAVRFDSSLRVGFNDSIVPIKNRKRKESQ